MARSRRREVAAPPLEDRFPTLGEDFFGWLGRAVALATVLSLPWLIEPWRSAAWMTAVVGTAASLLLTILSALVCGRSVAMPAVVWSILAAIGLGAAQLIPIDAATAQSLGSRSHELWERALTPKVGEATGAASATHEGQAAPMGALHPVSLYPAGTRRDMSMLGMAAAAVVVGATLFGQPRLARVLLGGVALNGLALAFVGISNRIAAVPTTFWSDHYPGQVAAFSFFLNRNQAGGYFNMCLAAALGCLLATAARRSDGDYSTDGEWRAPHTSWLEALTDQLYSRLANLTVMHLVWGTCVIVLVAGVLCSLSRGAMLSLGVGLLSTALVLVGRGSAAAIAGLVVMVAALSAFVALLGIGGTIGLRFDTLFNEQTFAIEPRLFHWNSTLAAADENWLLGGGLGAYRYIYPRYENRVMNGVFVHAENQYLETLIVGGVVGLALLVAAIVAMSVVAVRLMIASRRRPCAPFLAACVFLLTTQLAHAVVDFGMFSPVNLLLFAALCGSLASVARAYATVSSPAGARIGFGAIATRAATMGLCVALAAGLFYSAREVVAASVFEESARLTTVAESRDLDEPDWLNEQLRRARAALAVRQDDAEGRLLVARLQTKLHIADSRERLRKTLGAAPSDQDLDAMVTPLALSVRAWELSRSSGQEALGELRRLPSVASRLGEAHRDLAAARSACPLEARSHASLAELSFLGEPMTADDVLLANVAWLAPTDARAAFHASLVHLAADRWEEALACWRRCMELSRDYDNRIFALAKTRFGANELVAKALPPNAEVVIQAANALYPKTSASAARRILVDHVARLAEDESDPTRLYHRAWVARELGNHAEAAELLSAAIDNMNHPLEWEWELSQELETLGKYREAYLHASSCLRAVPDNATYRQKAKELLEKANRRPTSK